MKNIFVLGLDDFNLEQMKALDSAQGYRFHALFTHGEVKGGSRLNVEELHQGALQRLHDFPDPIDAIVGYWDFPVSTMLPLLRKPFDLPSPSFEAVLKCEHKYWSRVEQQQVAPEHIPDFDVVDPFADQPRQEISLAYPFWIKPVKAASSHLGFKVRNDAEFDHAIQMIRRDISRWAEPFNYLLQYADLPDWIAPIDGSHCVVEGIISRGRQCTLEGYVYDGETHVYGAIDSIREGRHRSSFSRYQYPSTIPQRIQEKMVAVTGKVMRRTGFDNGPFNIEFYWDSEDNSIWLLEINSRISKSHCPLFRDVDGATHHQVMLDLALGKRPDFPHRRGRYRYAAKFMWRTDTDAEVRHLPSDEQLQALQRRFPGLEIQIAVHEGMRLSDLTDQDSYSYEIAVIFLGGDSQKELLQKYRAVREALPLELAPVD